jgi:CubicO group peptidase (beta-lactamase class C family)
LIDSTIKDFMKRNEIVGASVAIAKHGKLVYAKGFGYADIDDSIKVSPSSLFRIASVSKLITGITIMKLIEEEKLSLDQKVFGPDGILNDSVFMHYKDKRIEQITIHDLLNHTGGWDERKPDPVFNSLYIAYKRKVTPPATINDVIAYALDQELTSDPGKKYHYSNLGYCILGKVIEKVTDMKYEEYVQFAILQPLGIFDMHIGKSFEKDLYANEVHYYDNDKTPEMWAFNGSHKMVPVVYGGNYIELLGPAGGWVASAPELAKLMVAVDGFEDRTDILNVSTIHTMTTYSGNIKSLLGWRGTDGYGTWWRTGTYTGTAALLMRHQNGINWVMLVNTSTKKKSKIHNDISKTMYSILHKVKELPDQDMFIVEPEPEEEFLTTLP